VQRRCDRDARPPVLRLRTDHPRLSIQAHHRIIITLDATTRLQHCSRRLPNIVAVLSPSTDEFDTVVHCRSKFSVKLVHHTHLAPAHRHDPTASLDFFSTIPYAQCPRWLHTSHMHSAHATIAPTDVDKFFGTDDSLHSRPELPASHAVRGPSPEHHEPRDGESWALHPAEPLRAEWCQSDKI
jgi:hypothetical protein